jgi:class 3 adenylate cyclase/CheY-like chemotaxis protein
MKDKPVILIVDDQPQNLELLEAHLVPDGYEIVKAANGEEALSKLSGSQIDLILLDVMMPGTDGFEVTRRIRLDKTYPLLPIILVTALRETEDRIKGIDAGCDDFISKPIDKMELLARVRSLLKVKAYNDLMSNYRKELESEVAKRTEELKKLTVVLSESNVAMRRFVPERFLKQLGKSSIEEVKLGDHIAMNMVVMFADIRDFSAFSEKMTPEETFTFINQYLAKVGPTVRNHGGFIDKYIGDGIMALFPTSPASAVRCAIEMHSRLGEFNAERGKAGNPPIRIGIGMHEGRLMLGTIGENERMDGTVIADTVNTASRIEGVSKQFGIGLAVSERILLGLEDSSAFHIRFIGKVGVKGRRDEVSIFEIYDGDPELLKEKKDSIKAVFERGLNAFYSQAYDQALEYFNKVLSELPDDQASFHYIRIIRKLSLS